MKVPLPQILSKTALKKKMSILHPVILGLDSVVDSVEELQKPKTQKSQNSAPEHLHGNFSEWEPGTESWKSFPR